MKVNIKLFLIVILFLMGGIIILFHCGDDDTVDPTPTGTVTGTSAGTSTGTGVPTGTDTGTPTGTDTGTATGTDTGTPTGTDTGTPTGTDTGTATGTISCLAPNSSSITSCGDLAANAYVISSLPYEVEGYCSGSDEANGNAVCEVSEALSETGSYWFLFTAPASGNITVELTDATLGGDCTSDCATLARPSAEIVDAGACDCLGSVMIGDCPGVNCTNNVTGLTSGNTYYILVSNDSYSNTYNWHLTVSDL